MHRVNRTLGSIMEKWTYHLCMTSMFSFGPSATPGAKAELGRTKTSNMDRNMTGFKPASLW